MNLHTYLKSKPIHSPTETEIFYWYNNYVLDGFLVDLATKKGLIRSYTDFNGATVYLNSYDLEVLIRTIQHYMQKRFPFKSPTGLDTANLRWQKTLRTFEDCLTNIDLENNKLYYYCTLSDE